MKSHPFKGYVSSAFNEYRHCLVGQFCVECSGTVNNSAHWEYQIGPTSEVTEVLPGDWRLG
jgi:hypothetical protein